MSHHAQPTDEEIVRQMLPDDCFWLGPVSGVSVSTLADNASNYAAFLDLSHRLNQQDWIHTSSSIPEELQAVLVEQPVGAFLFHDNDCSLLEVKRDLIINDSESSCSSNSNSSSSSAISSSYHCTSQAQDQENPQDTSQGSANDTNEPENLTSRIPIQDYSMDREKSTSSEENEVKPEKLTT